MLAAGASICFGSTKPPLYNLFSPFSYGRQPKTILINSESAHPRQMFTRYDKYYTQADDFRVES